MYFSPAFIAAAALYLTPLARADISRPNFTVRVESVQLALA